MIDPANVTNFAQSPAELEEFVLFWVCAAGKTARTAARGLAAFLTAHPAPTPFASVRTAPDLPAALKAAGIGCHTLKARAFRHLAGAGLDLAACTLADLEAVPGIGPKTARCFLLHSRPDQPYAGLDTHMLKFLRALGHAVPASTPAGGAYRRLEAAVLDLCRRAGTAPAALDLRVWRAYSGNGEDPRALVEEFKSLRKRKPEGAL